MATTLYSIAPSHPARAAGLMLKLKGIEHRLVNLPPGSQPVILRARGFRGSTVPALDIDGRRLQGSLEISRALEEVEPQPPLFPAEPSLRAAVEDAERWGESVYQPVPRRLFRWALTRDGKLREHLANESGLPAPSITGRLSLPISVLFAKLAGATEDTTRCDLEKLPHHLDRIDALIAEGVLNGKEPNAADFQIATTTRVLLNFPQLRGAIKERPAGEHAMRVAPDFGSEIPISFPPRWIES